MAQDINSLLTGFSNSLNQYLGLGIQNQMQQQNETRKAALDLEKGKQLKAYDAEMDLAKSSALKAYELTLAGKIDPEAAASLFPEAAKVVEDFNKTNGRMPTVDEFKSLSDSRGKNEENKLRQQELGDQRMNRFIEKHATNLANDQIPSLVTAINELVDTFNSGKNVEGIGLAESYVPNLFLGEQGVRNRTNLHQVANVLLKQRSGAAVTDQEYARFLKELQAGKIPDEKSIRTHLGKIAQDAKSLVALRESSIPKKALEEYKARPGAITSDQIKEIKFTPKEAEKNTNNPGGWSIKLKGK
jgi:hypothetical protein